MTAGLVFFGAWQARLTRKSIELARDEFIATHRPRIVVQRVDLLTKGDTSKNEPSKILVVMANAGETHAVINSWEADVYFWQQEAKFEPHVSQGRTDEKSFELNPGMFAVVGMEQEPIDGEYETIRMQKARMIVVGNIFYSGRDKITRNTGFCRQYDLMTGTWITLKDSEYEYCY